MEQYKLETWEVNVSMQPMCLLFYSQTVNFSSENLLPSMQKQTRGRRDDVIIALH